MLNQALWGVLNGGSLSKRARLNKGSAIAKVRFGSTVHSATGIQTPLVRRPDWEIRYRSLLQFSKVT
jgi:hypothetical protein